MSNKVYSVVTERIIELLEQGVAPWRRPWNVSGTDAIQVSIRGRAYRGFNALILMTVSMMEGYQDNRWITMREANKRGGKVRKGEKGTPVLFWKWVQKKDAEEKFPICRYYKVYNIEQTDGVSTIIDDTEDSRPGREHNPIDAADAIIDGYEDKPEITFGGGRACYIPKLDIVRVPSPEDFEGDGAFYATLFHECVHSTGHESRLGRSGVTQDINFGSTNYSQEELIAEMGAAFLCALCGIDNTIENSAAYCQSWLKKLKNDPKMIVMASQQAQKAVDHIRGETNEQ